MKNKDITPYNDNGNRHGYWEVYWSNANLFYRGTYDNGKPHGYWEYLDGDELYKKQYYII